MSPYKFGGGKPRRWPRVIIVGLILAAAVFAGLIGVTHKLYLDNLKPVNIADTAKIIFVVDSGQSVDEIAAGLEDKNLIRSASAFKQYVRSHGIAESLKAGTYQFSPSQGVAEIAAALSGGKVDTNLFTILPGKRLDQIKNAFIEAGFNEAEVDQALSAGSYAGHPALAELPAGATLEGYLYPDSYEKTAATAPSVIVKAALDEMDKYLTAELKAAYAARGLSVHQAVTLASVVEREVNTQEDRAKAAQVFYKRINLGMMLGSDVTAIFGAVHDGVELPDSYADALAVALAHDSPYNTRIHTGLPPGPISNVTESGLKAVANPANTDYLFFVTGDDRITYFSRTVEEHENLIEQHCVELCGR